MGKKLSNTQKVGVTIVGANSAYVAALITGVWNPIGADWLGRSLMGISLLYIGYRTGYRVGYKDITIRIVDERFDESTSQD